MTESPDFQPDKDAEARALRTQLARAKGLRGAAAADPQRSADRTCLRQWQAARLARTHADLLASQRYGEGATFFLSDLYGPKDFSERDDEIERILPMMIAVLPAAGVRAVALAVEVDALSEDLDAGVADALRRDARIESIDDAAYADAYRSCGRRAERERQIRLIGDTGRTLARLTRMPFVALALRLMHGPAHLAGLGELHSFLQRGFDAFLSMGDPEEFLETIRIREIGVMERLFAGDADPFGPPAEAPAITSG
jgi:hypothetical protein